MCASGSLRIGHLKSSAAAKSALVFAVSTLAAKHCTFVSENVDANALSDRHSAVHPPVKALGNHAITTALRPRKSLNRYVMPSDAGREKSGATSPRRRTTGATATRPNAAL